MAQPWDIFRTHAGPQVPPSSDEALLASAVSGPRAQFDPFDPMNLLLKPIEVGPKGTKKGVQTTFDAKGQTVEQTPIPIDETTMQQIIARADQMAGGAAARSDIERIQAMADVLAKRSPQLDLTPLAALVDAETGSNFTRTYKAPESPAAQLTTALGAIQERRAQMAKSILDAAKAMGLKPGERTTLQAGVTKNQVSNEAENPIVKPKAGADPAEKAGKAYHTFQQDFLKVSKKPVEALAAVPLALEQIDQNSSQSVEMLKRALLNMGGDTRPSDRDVMAFGGDSRLLELAQQLWDKKITSGGLSDLNKEQFHRLITGMAAVAADRFKAMVDGHIRNAKRNFPALKSEPEAALRDHLYSALGYTPEQIVSFKNLGQYEKKAAAAKKGGATGGGGILSPEEFFKQKGKQ